MVLVAKDYIQSTKQVSQGEVQSTSTLNNWARYIDRINRQDLTRLITIITSRVYT